MATASGFGKRQQADFLCGTSKATATFDRARDWEDANLSVLTPFLRGTATNGDATVAVILEDAAGSTATMAGTVEVTMDTGWAGLFNEGVDRDTANQSGNAPVALFRAFNSSQERLRFTVKKDEQGTPPPTGADRLWYINGQDGPDVRDGKWHHIVATFDAHVGHPFYIDGLLRVEVASTGVVIPEIIDSTSVSSIDYGLIVGAMNTVRQDGSDPPDQNGFRNYFSGWIDEITCYTRALSGPAVDRIYRQGPIIQGDPDGKGLLGD